MPSKNVGAMPPSAFGNGENEAEARLPLIRTLGIDMVVALVVCDSAAVSLPFGMILNSSSAVPKKHKRTIILSSYSAHPSTNAAPPYSKITRKNEFHVMFM